MPAMWDYKLHPSIHIPYIRVRIAKDKQISDCLIFEKILGIC